MVTIVPFLRVIRIGIYWTTAARGFWLIKVHQNWRHGSNVMKSAQDDRLPSANDVINLIFKMAPRLIKRVYTVAYFQPGSEIWILTVILRYINKVWIYPQQLNYIKSGKDINHPHSCEVINFTVHRLCVKSLSAYRRHHHMILKVILSWY